MAHILFPTDKCAFVGNGIAPLALTLFFMHFDILFYMEVCKLKCTYMVA